MRTCEGSERGREGEARGTGRLDGKSKRARDYFFKKSEEKRTPVLIKLELKKIPPSFIFFRSLPGCELIDRSRARAPSF